ncbi:MAG: endolytic transglycosylase MltG [Candidatus Kapaibacterium sp.]|jgi:UPF0755 protein
MIPGRNSRGGCLSFLLILAAVLGVYVLFFLKNPASDSPPVMIIIPKGASIQSVTDSLVEHHVLRFKWSFKWSARLMGASSKLHAGAYKVAYGLSNKDIVQRLTGTEFALVVQATFPEGLTIRKVSLIAKEKLGIDTTLFMRYATDTAFLHSIGVPKAARTAEGYLFPNTYQFILSADPKTLITRMVTKWKSVVTDSMRKKAQELELTIPELMTFASIVESEARLATERDTIAGVYWNRLDKDIKLDADPTVQYGLHLDRPITHEDLLAPNPYNTYTNKGLPPGPINSPGAAAIRAVLYPAKHNKFYFVARRDGSGGHFFSNSLDEQSRMINVAHRNANE